MPGHLPLITLIRPGFVRVHVPGEQEPEQIFVAVASWRSSLSRSPFSRTRLFVARILMRPAPRKLWLLLKPPVLLLPAALKSLVLKRRSLPWLPSLLLFANCVASSDRSQRRHSNERRCSVRTSAHFLLVCGRILRNACPRLLSRGIKGIQGEHNERR